MRLIYLASLKKLTIFALCAVSVVCNCAEVRLNNIQVIGSHNSYKAEMSETAREFLLTENSKKALDVSYFHDSLTSQLNLGLRHLELDVLLDPNGGRFAQPYLEELANKALLNGEQRKQHRQAGLKVLHIPDVDVTSHCITFVTCLEQVKAWSNANPNHLPIFIMLNVKESGSHYLPNSPTKVSTFKQQDYQVIDDEIRSVLANKLVTPRVLQGTANTLRQAVLKNGWPTLEESLGKFVFFFDGNVKQRALYLQGHPSLQDRTMFTMDEEQGDAAAIFIFNNPQQDIDKIRKLTGQGFIVRTRSDASMSDGILANQARVDTAFNSGAQIISTDFYQGSPQTQKYGFAVNFQNANSASHSKTKFTRCLDSEQNQYRGCAELLTKTIN